MYEAIKNFNKQFEYQPEIKNEEKLVRKNSFLIVGMGGSAHAPKLLKTFKPSFDLIIQQDYHLPKLPKKDLENKLIILSSYSGNTEEVLSAFEEARKENLDLAV